ncbi:MAG TPA: EAL domain-containing protein, partial [Anaerolineales bacterium]|nr:EAL domain-containing protein [Anaerolineales bacterium]
RILFILDCCYSEAFIPPSKSVEKPRPSRDLIDEASFPQAEGRIAIFSSPRNVQSRESYEKKNGIFTYHLVEGLKGGKGAVEETGDVTVESLLSYIKLRIPDSQPAGFAGKMINRFVLTRNHVKMKLDQDPSNNDFWKRISQDVSVQDSHNGVQLLQNPLLACLPFIDNLLAQVNSLDISADEDVGPLLLNVVKNIYDAQFVSVIRIDNNKAKMGYTSQFATKAGADNVVAEFLGSQVLRVVNENKLPVGVLGITNEVKVSRSDAVNGIFEKNMIVLLRSGPVSDFLVVYGISAPGLPFIGEAYATILKSLYTHTNELNVKLSYSELKASVLDDLKATYNFVPLDLYEERFELFRTSLMKTHVVFEPILYLDPVFLDIFGWEALARVGDATHAPVHLFRAAEMWGTRFMIELDKHMIRMATHSYRNLINERGIKPSQIPALSVNVYPASLIRRAYREEVEELISSEKILPGDKLVLEISEKLPIVTDMPLNEPDALREFKRHLTHYTSAHRINFAIDDFGVGYSSVSRLASISPFYVKIDRDVLLRKDFCELTLDYVKRMVEINKTSSPVIVIEGFDGSTAMAVTLRQIFENGIKYVQGYVVGRAGPELYDLSDSLTDELKHRLTD